VSYVGSPSAAEQNNAFLRSALAARQIYRWGLGTFLTPQVVLANQTGLSAAQIRQAQTVVHAHLKEIQDAWSHHFGS
jgi:hypothetical protein